MIDTLTLFSSHRWAYGEHRDGLHVLLRPWQKGIDFIDLSVTAAHPVQVYGNRGLAVELVRRIRQSDVFLTIAGMYANHSDWMKREIDWAFALGKYIVPIIPHHQLRVAATATDFGSCAPVHWRGDSIKEAILLGLGAERARTFLNAVQRRAMIAGVAAAAARQTVLSGSNSARPMFRASSTLAPPQVRRTVLGSLPRK